MMLNICLIDVINSVNQIVSLILWAIKNLWNLSLRQAVKFAKMSSSSGKSVPKDAQVMTAILKEMGVNDHDPRLINQMLEFTYSECDFLKQKLSLKTF